MSAGRRRDDRAGRRVLPLEYTPGRNVRREGKGCGARVEITIVFASHANNVPLSLLSEAQRKNLAPDDASLALGPPTGYVVKFTNGLTAYLSGDTGIHTETKTVVNEYHRADLAVLNLGSSAVTVASAAHAVNELVRPASVILTHVNEAATQGGNCGPRREPRRWQSS